MGKSRRVAVDDDDDDVPARVGRSRAPEVFGPPKPERHQREDYVKRLQAILDTLEIGDVCRDGRMHLQRILWRGDLLHSFDPRRFTATRGDDRVVLIVRSIAETTNGPSALTPPIMRAVDDCLADGWMNRGLEFLEAMDRVPLLEIQSTLAGFGLEAHLHTAIGWKLREILGSPIVQPKKPKAKAAPSVPKIAPAGISQSTWDAVIALHKANQLRLASGRAARMAA